MRSLFAGLVRTIVRILALIGAVAVVLGALLLDFVNRATTPERTGDLPGTAVVFTGDFDRIRAGLDLLSEGRVDRLFITGVNGDAGLDPERFATQFSLPPEQVQWLDTGRIVLAPDAHTTIENAWETGCWLDRQPDAGRAVALITSRSHMARASVALRNELWPVGVVRVVSDPGEAFDIRQLSLLDFAEYAATWAITLLPHGFWPGVEPAICLTGGD